jgi:crotonobetainyl-CoA:carnitine CoA-transferase CaiB-like acyl-CoA transferase
MPASDAVLRDPMMARLEEMRANGAGYPELMKARNELTRPGGSGLWYGAYRVKDGAVALGSLTPANQDQMRRVLGISDDPTADPNFNILDPANHEALRAMRARVEAIMLTRTMEEWLEAFEAEGAPIAKVQFPEELADDPQVEALGVMLDLDHPATGPERIVGPIVEMSETPTGSSLPSPILGAHTEEVLRECGLSEQEIAEVTGVASSASPAV